ncbi:hypothetical protein JAAARDRAFT_37662 [Jaapia argillacea MUCL 33604]|uniref:Peptidyl-prolyl cis-trans isomerase n=1 Tax=Jaapia argillacea MUCL 33604 TaxID=933084 RepID=A0A067PV40_9AGAM|nr:hypothetical protein JAAARDRAFT_37662 [Jaapia argillacea MUCL 33604]
MAEKSPDDTSPKVFFDINIDSRPAGRIVFKLYDHACPKTAKNFRDLSTGVHGFGYRGSAFHRIIPQFMVQGGDITRGDGTGGRSIYGATFADENLSIRHDKPGLLSMANRGPGSNSSQFFITTTTAPWCDGMNVVFGEVVDGMDVVRKIEAQASDDILRKPRGTILITDSGIL